MFLFFYVVDPNVARYIQQCKKQVQQQDKQLQKTYQNMFESMALPDDDEVFSADADDPDLVEPQRKLEKASSIA